MAAVGGQAQVGGADLVVFGQGQGAFEDVFQLADVAREAVLVQRIERGLGQ